MITRLELEQLWWAVWVGWNNLQGKILLRTEIGNIEVRDVVLIWFLLWCLGVLWGWMTGDIRENERENRRKARRGR